MKLVARRLDLPPDPLRLARALVGEPGAVLLGTGGPGGVAFAACRPVASAEVLDPEPDLPLAPAASALHQVPRWIGLLPYESRRCLERPALTRAPEDRPPPHLERPLWLRYGAVARIAEDVRVIGDDRGAVAWLSERLRRAPPPARGPRRVRIGPVEVSPDALHEERIRRALELIAEGEIYQVNLARRFTFRAEGDPLAFLEGLAGRHLPRHALALDAGDLTVAAASPELFLRLQPDGRLLTCPIKGTRPRGADAASDDALRADLDGDPKERAELTMVIDVERNDLGRIARTGSVRVPGSPRVETFGTVHHRVARVAARLRSGVARGTLLEAMLPSGSVTGAPKVRAMEVIAALETERRGLYTGAFGALCHDGSLELGMAIRTLTARDGVAHYFAGGGIVFGSDPAREVLETRWKAVRVLSALGRGERTEDLAGAAPRR